MHKIRKVHELSHPKHTQKKKHMEYVRAHGVEKKYIYDSKVLGVPAVEIGKSTSNHPLHRAPATTQVTKNFGLVQDLGLGTKTDCEPPCWLGTLCTLTS